MQDWAFALLVSGQYHDGLPPLSFQHQASHSVTGLGPTLLVLSKDIKLAHSVFALPFALLASAMVLHKGEAIASATLPARAPLQIALVLGIIVLCMVLARTFAMVVNRLADRTIDAGHVRTKNRAFAAGSLAPRAGMITIALCGVLFVLAASLFGVLERNWLPAILAIPVLAMLALYSFTKRFTALCHLVLGVCLAASPLCAAVALGPGALHVGSEMHIPSLWFISGFVLCWVAGFDIIYALQDQHYDSAKGLHSIPAALGTRGSVWASRTLHLLALASLVGAIVLEPRFGWLMWTAMAIVAALLCWEHTILTQLARKSAIDPASPPPALNLAFFTLNGIVSCVIGVLGIADLFV
jgi:4-hydroxybenzoate polyprenyltransferase